MNYNLNIISLVRDVLPSFMRGDRQSAWLQSLTKPVVTLRDTFLGFVNQTNQEMVWNGQTIAMEDLLSTRFGEGVTIVNQNSTARPFYVYGSSDARNPGIYEVGNDLNPIAGAPGAFDPNQADFTVKVPASIVLIDDDLDEMSALIRKYKIYSKRFNIELES